MDKWFVALYVDDDVGIRAYLLDSLLDAISTTFVISAGHDGLSTKSLDGSERVIYLGSFSSTLFAAVKISYMVLPEAFARVFSKIATDYSQTCSKMEQLTLAMFMETGYYQTHIKKIRKLYSQKLMKVTEAFAKYASDFVEIKDRESGINIPMRIVSEKTARQLKKEALSAGLPSVIMSSSPGETDLIFYYNQIPLSDIDTVIAGLVRLWRS